MPMTTNERVPRRRRPSSRVGVSLTRPPRATAVVALAALLGIASGCRDDPALPTPPRVGQRARDAGAEGRPPSSDGNGSEAELRLRAFDCQQGECRVSLPQVLANMETFDGVVISTQGYLNVEYEVTGIFPYREDFERGTSNFLQLTDPEDITLHRYASLHGRYVTVVGRFEAGPRGPGLLGAGKVFVQRITAGPGLARKAKD